MRNNTKHSNIRKFRFRRLFPRRRPVSEEWVLLADDEVSTPRPSPRRLRRRRVHAFKIGALVCLAISIPIGLKWSYGQIFYQNDEFILKSLAIHSDGILSEDRLAEIANVAPGMNLMSLDLGNIESQISSLPQVENVTVARELPDRLVISVTERVPIAWLSNPPQGIRPMDKDRGLLLDANGYLYRCLDLNDGMRSLPVLESYLTAESVEGARIESTGARTAVKLIVASDAKFLSKGLVIKEVKVRDDWAIECVYTNDLKVIYGVIDYQRGIEDLALIVGNLAKSSKVLSSVNVVAEKNIPVTFEDAPSSTVASSGGSGYRTKEIVNENLKAISPPKAVVYQDAESSTETSSAQDKHLKSILKGG